MPLFGKFSSKKTPPRKSSTSLDTNRDLEDYDFINDDNVIHLCLDQHELIFEDGQWITESEIGQTNKTNQKLRKQIQELKEENNLLKLKFEILLDMFTENTVDAQNVGRKKNVR